MKPYAQLTEIEKWEWHSDVYAFRRVVLNVSADEHVSPCDTEGKWYNEPMIRAAAERLQEKRNWAVRQRQSVRDAALIAEGRDLCNQWARRHGYEDFAAAEAAGKTHADVIRSLPGLAKPMPRDRWTANQYGVTATEWKPSEEQMAEGRRALGFDTETEPCAARGDYPLGIMDLTDRDPAEGRIPIPQPRVAKLDAEVEAGAPMEGR